MKKKVALIFGGRSLERDISVITALQALKNIDGSKYAAEPIFMYEGDFYAERLEGLETYKNFDPAEHKKLFLISGGFYLMKRGKLSRYFVPDVALVCCHGGEGEDGVLQALLEYERIPYTSCSHMASALLMDKALSKRVFEAMLLGVLPHEEVSEREFLSDAPATVARLKEVLSYPMIVKPSRLGSSIGISAATNDEELNFALQVALKFDNVAVVERKLTDYTEVNCAAVRDGDKILISETEQPLGAGDFLTFEDKYAADGKMSGGGRIMPADIGPAALIVKAVTERVYRELMLGGVVRVDYLLDNADGRLYVNEINTVPGSLAYYLFEGQGLDMRGLLTLLIENANLKEHTAPAALRPEILSRFSSGTKGAKRG